MKPADDRPDPWIAVTFAEAGEWETARRYGPPARRPRLWPWIERHLVAAALAEEALHDDAVRVLRNGGGAGTSRREDEALDALLRGRGIRLSFGVLSPEALGARP